MKNIEKQKEELKEQISEEIDRYYEEITKGLENKSLKIEEIERLLKEKKTKLNELLIKSTGEAVGERATEKKLCKMRRSNESAKKRARNKNKDNKRGT